MWINTGKRGEKDDDDVLYLKCDTIPNDEALAQVKRQSQKQMKYW